MQPCLLLPVETNSQQKKQETSSFSTDTEPETVSGASTAKPPSKMLRSQARSPSGSGGCKPEHVTCSLGWLLFHKVRVPPTCTLVRQITTKRYSFRKREKATNQDEKKLRK